MSYTLAVMDLHTHPGDNFRRHEAIGKMILEDKPSEIISVGDFCSLDSCSEYDQVKRCTMAEDIEATKHATELMFGPMNKWNKNRAKNRHKKYHPRTIWCDGNHEQREERLRKKDPGGYASLIDFWSMIAPPSIWQERYKYGEVVNVRGVDYTHCPLNTMGKAASMAWIRKHTSRHLVWGHTHRMCMETIPQVAEDNSVRGLLNGPACLDQDTKEHYCERNTTGWTYGLLKIWPRGPKRMFMFEFMDTEELENKYL